MALFSSSKKKKTIVVLDIGSASVGGAVVSLESGKKPHILMSTREDMVFQRDLNLERLLSSMLSALEKVLHTLRKTSPKPSPSRFFCILSSPWYKSVTKIIRSQKDAPFTVTKKMLDELVEKDASLFRAEIETSQKTKEPVEPIDTHIIQIKLNGYETSDPLGKEAHAMELALFIGLSSSQTIEAIRSKVARVFHYGNISFSAFSLAAFSTSRDIFTDKKNFLFLDISGEITDIAMVKDNVILETVSFPLGRNFLFRRLASSMNATPDEAISLFRMARGGKSDETTQARTEKALSEARKEWLASFSRILANLAKGNVIPSTVFFTADQDISSWFSEAMREEEFGQFTLTDEMFNVAFLGGEMLEKFCSVGSGVPKDPFIMLEAIFAEKHPNI